MATVTRSRKESLSTRRASEPAPAAPPATSRRRSLLISCAGYLTAAALSSLFVACTFSLWKADLSTPITHVGDAMLNQVWIKGVFEHGWYLHNPNLGAPAGMDMHDFPMSDCWHFFLMKMLCYVLPNYVMVFNAYYLLGYPLAAVTALFLLRQSRVSYAPALLASLLFALLPYHFLRGQHHLLLTSYYVVPLSILVALWLYLGRIGGSSESPADRRDERRRLCGSFAIAALQSSAGVYYAFFACFFLLIGGMAAALDSRRWRPLIAAALLIGVTASGVVLNLSPSLLYWRQHGRNSFVANRHPLEAEIYGLKIGQLLLPDHLHRIPNWSRVRNKYDAWPLAEGEKVASTLGFVGGVGFLFLLGSLLCRRRDHAQPSATEGLAIFNFCALLVATIGGFGSLFNFLIFEKIRCYNRISIFIAMFSLFAAALILDRFIAWWTTTGRKRWQLATLLTALAALSLADAAGLGPIPDHAGLKADFQNDAEFVGRIEAAVPPGSMVFQLPYVSFPEAARIVDLWDYQLSRPYFHSRSLRWSYGAMKGREEDKWQRETAALPLPKMVKAVAQRGFAGLYIDRFAYEDRGAALEAELSELLGHKPIESGNDRLSFYTLPQSDTAPSGDSQKASAQ